MKATKAAVLAALVLAAAWPGSRHGDPDRRDAQG